MKKKLVLTLLVLSAIILSVVAVFADSPSGYGSYVASSYDTCSNEYAIDATVQGNNCAYTDTTVATNYNEDIMAPAEAFLYARRQYRNNMISFECMMEEYINFTQSWDHRPARGIVCCHMTRLSPAFSIATRQEYPYFEPVVTVEIHCDDFYSYHSADEVIDTQLSQFAEALSRYNIVTEADNNAAASSCSPCTWGAPVLVSSSTTNSNQFCWIRTNVWHSYCVRCGRLMLRDTLQVFSPPHSWGLEIVNGTVRSICMQCGWRQ